MSLLGRDDHRNPYAPRGSDFGLPDPAPISRVAPLSEHYRHIIPLAAIDLQTHYACLRCQKRFSVPVLLSLSFDFARRLDEALEKHELCELDKTWTWTALGELVTG